MATFMHSAAAQQAVGSQATRQSFDKCIVLLIDLLHGHFYERSSTAAVLAI